MDSSISRSSFRFFSDGRILSEEERAAENIYIKVFNFLFIYTYIYLYLYLFSSISNYRFCFCLIDWLIEIIVVFVKKMEKEKLEKQKLKEAKEKAEKEKAEKVS